jgi:hypothetical protein
MILHRTYLEDVWAGQEKQSGLSSQKYALLNGFGGQ